MTLRLLSSFCVLTFSLLFIMNERKEAFLREFWALIWNLIFTQSLVSTILSAAIENVSIFSLILSLSLSHSHMLSLALYVSLSIFLSHFVSSSFCLSFYLSRSRMTNVLHRCASYVLSLLVIGTMPRDENGEEKIWDEKTEERKPNEMQGQCALDRWSKAEQSCKGTDGRQLLVLQPDMAKEREQRMCCVCVSERKRESEMERE